MSRPTTQRLEFSNSDFPELGTFTVPPLVNTVTFRYLAGFGRQNVHQECKLNTKLKLKQLTQNASSFLDAETGVKTDYFKAHLDKLDLLKAAFAQSRGRAPTKMRPLHDMCVGLDYFGDEMFYPHCSFAHVDFVNFLLEERDARNNHFGFRIHAGELFKYKNARFMDIHMGVVSANIEFILTKYENQLGRVDALLGNEIPTDVPPPIRIGHGQFSVVPPSEFICLSRVLFFPNVLLTTM